AISFLLDFSETAGRMSGLPGYTIGGGVLMTAVRLPLILQQTVPFIALFVGMTVLISENPIGPADGLCSACGQDEDC
ncbi:hypothetical protein ACCT09_57210, partial [Rhizobium ruizarguesonis]